MSSIRSFDGKEPTLGANVYIDSAAVVIGDVVLGDNVNIWPMSVLRGDIHRIQIGTNTNIQDGSVLHVTGPSATNPNGASLVVGEDVTVGHKVILHGCKIGNRVLVGMGSIVLDGAEIGDDVMVGAGSLVPPNKRLASGYLYLGNPVKQVRPLTEDETAFLKQSAKNYVLTAQSYQ